MSIKNHLIKSTTIISLSTVFSRILGFIRDMIIARFLGTTILADVFFAGFGIPNMLRRLFGEGALSAGLVPVFTEKIEKNNQEETNLIMSSILWQVFVISLFLSLIVILFAPFIVKIIVPGFNFLPDKMNLTVKVTRCLIPYIIFLGISAVLMSILNSYKHFFLPAVSPAFFNLGIIITALIIGYFYNRPLLGIVGGVIFGGFLQVLIQCPAIFHKGFKLKFVFWHPEIKKIFKMIAPAVFALAISEINIVVTRIFASWESLAGKGAISILYYANRLIQMPIGIFGVAISTAILPTLSTQVLENNIEKVKQILNYAFRLALFIIVPATIGLIILRVPIVRLLFERGQFTSESTQFTAQALLFYSLGITGYAGVKIIIPVFYSLRDTVTPAKIGIVILIISVFLDFLLVWLMKFSGLALSISLSNFIQLVLLVLFLRKKIGSLGLKNIFKSFFAILSLSLGMGIVCLITVGLLEKVLILSLLSHQIFEVVFCIFVSALFYFGFSFIFKLKEMEIVFEIIKRKR